MRTPRHKATHNPIPTSLFCFKFSLLIIRKSQEIARKRPDPLSLVGGVWVVLSQRVSMHIYGNFVMLIAPLLILFEKYEIVSIQ